MSTLDWARTQFAVTTLFHFIFVPMSIGLALFVAICQTRWQRTGDDVYLRMTRFWGKFLLISMAVGVVTGIVQEFQFGMNWSQYSRFVGTIFGAPLAMEGLIAFFMESTFLGLWIFGWGRLPRRVHLACAWAVAGATVLSAYFILAANSWMQHPVGYRLEHGRAVLTSIWAVLTNSTVLLAFPHTVLGAFTTGGMLVVAVCGLLLLRGRRSDVVSRSLRMALPFTLAMVLATMILGDSQGRMMVHQQPMKMAAAEALYHTSDGASFSVFSTGPFTLHPTHLDVDLRIPHLLSLIEDLSWNGKVTGIDQLMRADHLKYGSGQYMPVVAVLYWSFRLMIAAGTLMLLVAAVGMFLAWRGRLESTRWFHRLALFGVVLPILANWSGWIFTEIGRQPWVVYGLQRTAAGRSPNVSTADIVITLAGYIVIYGVLIVLGAMLMLREVAHGPQTEPTTSGDPGGTGSAATAAAARDDELTLAY